MRRTFHAKHTKLHSPRAALIPRNENCRNFITRLINPNTGSTVH